MSAPSAPVLSVVVAIVSDTATGRTSTVQLEQALSALAAQTDAPSMEIIVPFHPGVSGIESTRTRYPEVTFLPVDLKTFTGRGGTREHHDELRARGLDRARGEIVALIEDHGRPDPRWAARIAEAHRKPYAAWGGAIENEVELPLNWAVYFCDFGRYQNPVPEGPSWFASDANVSYKRSSLEAIRLVWQDVFQEPAVNSALRERGEQIGLSPSIVLYQNRRNLRLGEALKERFVWGRSYAASRRKRLGSKTLMYAALCPALPFMLLFRMAAGVFRKGRCTAEFVRASPFTFLLVTGWACGEFAGYTQGLAE